jgi:streptogrisin C
MEVLTAVAVIAASWGGAPASAADNLTAVAESAVSAQMLGAMQRDLGLSKQAALTRLAQEGKANELHQALPAKLGAGYAGSYFDAKQGRLVVNITDGKLARQVADAGATPRLVKHSLAKLDQIMSTIDAMAGIQGGAAERDRARSAKAGPAVDGLVAWRNDPTTNTVHVTALSGREVPALAKLRGFGDSVTIGYMDRRPSFATGTIAGGDPLYSGLSQCSSGFYLRDSAGQGYLTTAGHCFRQGDVLEGPDRNTGFGRVLEVWSPLIFMDDAIIRNDNPGFWTQLGGVTVRPPMAGGTIPLDGLGAATPGVSLCKSGISTLLTCGTVVGVGENVLYEGGFVVRDQTHHTACAEPGDSGGVTYTLGAGVLFGEGTTTGGVLYDPGIGLRLCGDRLGLRSDSFSWPVRNFIPYYTARYGAAVVLR